jgi:hypothetical protein
MGYNLQNDFDYIQEQLATIAVTIGIDLADIQNLTLDNLMESCSNVFGAASHDPNSPIAIERHAELRRHQMSLRRFWYLFHVLKWRLDNE